MKSAGKWLLDHPKIGGIVAAMAFTAALITMTVLTGMLIETEKPPSQKPQVRVLSEDDAETLRQTAEQIEALNRELDQLRRSRENLQRSVDQLRYRTEESNRRLEALRK